MLCTLSKKARIPAAFVSYLFGFSRANPKPEANGATHKRLIERRQC